MDNDKMEQLKFLLREANHMKHELMRLEDQIEEVSPRKAKQLNKIIGRLEYWQNTK